MTAPRQFSWMALWCTLAGFAVLCGLGAWQIERLHWKQDILSALNTEYNKEDSALDMSAADLDTDFSYRRGRINGNYDLASSIRVGPRYYDNLPGHHVLTPLQLENGIWLIVNRGWVTQHYDISGHEGTADVEVTGLLRKPGDRNAFTLDNDPEKNLWYYTDPAQLAKEKGLNGRILPYVLYLEQDTLASEDGYPIPAALKPEIANNHLSYAIFWFTMAAILLVIFTLRFLKK